MKILGLHIRDTKNVGDRWSSPLDYLAFEGHEVTIGDMRSPPDVTPDLVIYGGGTIIASPEFRPGHAGQLTVAWGVGHHVRQRPWDGEMEARHELAAQLCHLYFPRDTGTHGELVPCASCMNPVFDNPPPAPVHDVVRYSAARRVMVDEPADTPHMTNEDGTIEEAVAFLASGRTVVTSSYHGAYWARLLRREVRLVPWGSKFSYLPTLSLAEARAANRNAHAAVLGLITGR